MKRTDKPSLITLLMVLTGACAPADQEEPGEDVSDGNVVEVTARGLTLEAPGDDTGLDELAMWMDWRQPTGLETPAPAEFVGGTNEMPAGGTAYFTVALESGRYAWIAEVPDPEGKGMLKAFSVP